MNLYFLQNILTNGFELLYKYFTKVLLDWCLEQSYSIFFRKNCINIIEFEGSNNAVKDENRIKKAKHRLTPYENEMLCYFFLSLVFNFYDFLCKIEIFSRYFNKINALWLITNIYLSYNFI